MIIYKFESLRCKVANIINVFFIKLIVFYSTVQKITSMVDKYYPLLMQYVLNFWLLMINSKLIKLSKYKNNEQY